ncbi:TPA: hypothetical protein HIF88_003779 [Escherichia coli]|uniref:plasmid transfer protein HtdO n=1 Tax=Escherichia coli TaxID=562 RepID=UPI0010CC08AF|nr:plasmid transfer protein HtdO [Escherichia coli]EFG3097677.1 hypothetical protein [Escherichia coli]EFG5951218.1 hypothetical protein [Escherichia coli]EGD9986715.1 hypothetical protein [Escherichia coli]EHX5684270.1 hypothetical protein [Escherichia coli]GCM98493.1 hypothetical protein BvCms734_04744 [Escherichia coli]
MGKVTLPALLGAIVIGFVVFALTSFYYRSEYIPKRSVLIVPDAPISIEDGSNAFPVQTVIMNDPTLIDKFVGEDNINEENAFDYHKSNVLEPNYKHEISRTSQIDKAEMNHPSVRENWARAGDPYIVPQMSDSERNLKIKRFQKPTSGANHGH